MLPVKLQELIYYVTNKPYFVVYVLKNGRKVKRFIQLAADKAKGSDLFLISPELKSSWWKPDKPVVDGLKFICFVDLNNAVPLLITREINTKTGDIFIKEYDSVTIREDEDEQKKHFKDGKPLELAEIAFPPTLLFQMTEAHFVKEIMSVPPNKNEWMTWVFIAGILGLCFIAYLFITSSGAVRLL